MQIAKNHVVRFHYAVAEAGQAHGGSRKMLESSFAREPLTTLIGHGGIISGLESALMGRAAGDRFEVTIAPEDAYGPIREDFGLRVPKKHFKAAEKLKPGMQTTVNTNQGPRRVTVKKVGMTVIDIDLNHSLAGKTLDFEIEILEVRESSPEERRHGHAHGPGGYHHEH